MVRLDTRVPPIEEAVLANMMKNMQRRGPDGEGLWIEREGRVGFGHRRLAIIDLSEAARQPLWSHDGRLVITFNGEIYNYRELREELKGKGAEFLSHSDTEVILELYRLEGPEGFSRLRGMYAFAIWDMLERRLVLARDPFGIKPLYVYGKDGDLRFASQVKALLVSGNIDTTVDPAGHAGFGVWGHVPEPFTLYRHISAFPAGHYQIIEAAGKTPPRQFADIAVILQQAERGGSQENNPTSLQALIHDSIRHHHVSDVPVGVFLSAGKDSSVVAALSSGVHSRRLRTFTLGFEEYRGTANDEVPLSEETAGILQAEHTTRWVSKRDFIEALDDILAAMDQPSVDGVNTYLVAKYAAESGLKVALSGLGGDELFGGYPSFTDVPRSARLLGHFPQSLGVPLRQLTRGWIGKLTSPKYAGLLEYGGTVAGAYLLRRALYMPWELEKIMDPDMAKEGLERLMLLPALNEKIAGLRDPYLAVMLLEMTVYMRDRLLRDSDWASMAHSLELRTPLVDWQLFSALAPALAHKGRPDKQALAKVAINKIPAGILNRPKSGFTVPVRDWLLSEYGENPRGLRSFASLVYKNHAA